MFKGHEDKLADMGIGEPGIEHRPLAAVGHQGHLPEQPQLMAHRRFADPEKGGQIADAHLLLVQGLENLEPGRVGKGLEELSEFVDLR